MSNHSRRAKDISKIVPLKFLREAFEVKQGVLYWREDRPKHHFRSDSHYKRWTSRYAGKPAGTTKASIGYAQIRINLSETDYIFVYIHRIIFALTHGFYPPTNMVVDHKTRDPLQNDPSQLRLATLSGNNLNHSRTPVNTYFGVYPTKSGKRWYAVGQERRHLGTFATEREAAIARDKYVVATGRGKFARLAFPQYFDAATDTYCTDAANDNFESKDQINV